MGPVSESTTAAAGDTDSPLGRFVWLNGSIVPTAEAKVSVLDRGLLRGEGVFETMRTYGGALFAAGRHLARMQMSADAAGVRLPPPEVLREAVSAAVAANGFPESRVQLTVTSGPGGPTPDPIGHPEPTLVVIVLPLGSQTARPVVTAVTLPWIRHESAALTGVKPTSYLDHLVGHKWAHQQGADEGLWRNSAGEVTEATGSNLFVVRGGVVLPRRRLARVGAPAPRALGQREARSPFGNPLCSGRRRQDAAPSRTRGSRVDPVSRVPLDTRWTPDGRVRGGSAAPGPRREG